MTRDAVMCDHGDEAQLPASVGTGRCVIFLNDSIGIDRRGEPLRVDRDVVVTGIVPEKDGPLVAFRPYA